MKSINYNNLTKQINFYKKIKQKYAFQKKKEEKKS